MKDETPAYKKASKKRARDDDAELNADAEKVKKSKKSKVEPVVEETKEAAAAAPAGDDSPVGVFIMGLSYDAGEDEVREFFKDCGEIVYVHNSLLLRECGCVRCRYCLWGVSEVDFPGVDMMRP